jgi:hypothetical protein
MFSLLLLKLGQPWFATVPLTCGHLSSLSNTPSPSVSGQGQPAFSLGPATVGHLSFYQLPSPSVSGQPLKKLDQPHWTLIIFICYTISISINHQMKTAQRICTIFLSPSVSGL